MSNFVCPQCHNPVGPDKLNCPHCGVDLALAAALAERQVLETTAASAGSPPYTTDLILPKFGEFLVANDYITEKRLQAALARQSELAAQGRQLTIGQILLEMGAITREHLDEASIQQVQTLQMTLRSIIGQLEQQVTQRTQELRHAMDKLAELNELKANFVATISHEFRTPLTQIKGYHHFLADGSLGPLNPMQQEVLGSIRQAIDRLSDLVENMLRFSSSLKGYMTLSPAVIALAELAESVVKLSEPKALRGNVRLRADVPASLPLVRADEEKIHWVLFQLLDNAIKFTPAGGEVALAAEADGQHVRVSVRDTGIGIQPERIPELFEPFHQLDNSDTRSYTGAGLGLALVKRILEAHETRLDVKSFPGQGSTFAFVLTAISPGQPARQ